MKSWLHSNQWQNSHWLQWELKEPGFCVYLSFFILPWYLYLNYLADYCLYRSKLKLSIHICQSYCLFSHQKKKKRMKKCDTYLLCCIIHFIAQSKENCLLHLLGGQNVKKKAKCCLCVIPNSKAFKELLFSALHVLSFGYGCHGI